MRALPLIKDPVYTRPERYTLYERWWLRYINDARDLPFIKLLTAIHLSVIPLAVLLYTPFLQGAYWWAAYALYFYIAQLYFK